jgi:glycosyltransferase involved in cell wall biosynthesis
MAPPLVSVIVPSYNQGQYIAATLDSIFSQDHRPLEVLVIDGASSDSTVDVLRRYSEHPELQWWSEPDRGVTDAVNKGLVRATGEILAIQSSDDLYAPGAISAAVSALVSDPALALVYGDAEYIDGEGRARGGTSLPPFDLVEYAGKRTFIPQPAAFFTRAAASAAGPWRAEVSYAADAEFYLRIATHHNVRKIDRVLARYRYHEAQRDKAGSRIARDWEKVVRDWLAENDVSGRTRRKALAGIHLTRAHYLSDAEWAPRTVELYRALVLDPTLLGFAQFPRRELIPGRQPIWKVLSKIKRALGFPPRTI